MEQTDTIMVIGAGQMGSGITQVAAKAGYKVLLLDQEPSQVKKSILSIEADLTLKNDVSSTERMEIIQRIQPASHLKESVQSDFIIEAATENLTIKKQIFSNLINYITQNTTLATNTSSLSITEIASATDCPERVIGMHFMNPAHEVMAVEIIKGYQTSDSTFNTTKELANSFGKEVIEVNDYPGFISNRLLMPMINEAIICVFDGVADAESIDRIMQLGRHHPMGPLRLADMIGLDTCLAIMEILHRGFDDSKYRPCPLLRNMVKAGKLGRKSGEGFYLYDNYNK